MNSAAGSLAGPAHHPAPSSPLLSMPAPLRLIVRADDAGSARAANEAILETVRRGIVRNVSVMAVGPELAHAAELLRELPGVALGFHAAINAEWSAPRWRPVLPPATVPSLVESDGAFTPAPIVLHERGFSLAELDAELRAQLARLHAHGLRPVYLDTHMGFDWLHGVPAVLDAIAADHGLVRDQPSTHPRLDCSPSALPEPIEEFCGAAARVLITHPGARGPEMHRFANERSPLGKIEAERDAERLALQSPPLLALVAQGRLVLETYA